MWNLLRLMSKNLVVAIPVAMVLGFLVGLAGDMAWLKSLIVPFTFLMVYPMMVTLKIREVFAGGDLRAQVITQLVNFAVVPFLAFGIGLLFFRDQPYLLLGLLLAGLVPTSGMTISWTGFAKGNVAAAVKMTVIGLTLGSLLTPFYVQALLGAKVSMNMAAVFGQIVLIVFLPMALGYATQRFLVGRYGRQVFAEQLAPRFPGLSTLGVLGIVFIALALKAQTIVSAPALLLQILVPLLLIYAINFTLSTVLGRALLPRGDAIAMVYGTVMRNLSIALAVAINAFGTKGSDAALVVALAYIIQVQSAAWYVRLTGRLFGPAPEPAKAQDPVPTEP
ncbi:MAG: bile acid:sodium symporter [Desulfobulbus sp.]|jgi:ACR3 family arsenite efflux pump ArsB|nr:bile acid:sodium symporter [Desulfobulbus sp.]